ncbi:hypothetical protein IWQ60_003148 [Tieghemiomyces parasiticus]|uniref:Methylated-DNA--protein-cysteine methyltransferase n=1 Tax=Tieghemiomyces parasiticus TaxID=78921 RepID=A0A9W8AA45_9FUNG|nr:hypothetical protein IWQ60_003148 [Tieghemiomyces parasiticus]
MPATTTVVSASLSQGPEVLWSDPEERLAFVRPGPSKRVTPFQFKVYDLCAQIPAGYFSTYKCISDALMSSPRAVGQALRNNPFAPLPVPCHRVLASNFYLGGFYGDWGCGKVLDKRSLLQSEDLHFDQDDFLLAEQRSARLFSAFKVPE